MKTSKIWIVVGIIVAIILVIFIFKKDKYNTNTPFDTTDNLQPVTKEEETPSTQNTVDTPPGAATISYNEALKRYADRRIQLDPSCQAFPRSVVYKDNTGIMIDNRSSQTRTVTIGSTFTIKPYGFKIVTLPDVNLKNKTILVDCDKLQNVATITVQE